MTRFRPGYGFAHPLIPAHAGVHCSTARKVGFRFACTSGIVARDRGCDRRRLRRDAAQNERVVNFYNWSDYIDPTVLDDFSKETGIKVRYDTFDSNDTLEAKLLAGKSGYDVVVPTGYFLARQIAAGIFQKLDKSKLPNLVNVWPEIASRLASLRSGQPICRQLHVGHDRDRLQRQGGARNSRAEPRPIDSWDDVFDPAKIAKFKDCGIHLLDSSDDIMPAALHYLHLDPNSSDPGDLQKAADLLAQDQAICAQVSFLRISQRARDR